MLLKLYPRDSNGTVNPLFLRNYFQQPFSSLSQTPKPLDQTTVLEALSSYSNDWKKALEFFTWAESQPGPKPKPNFAHSTQTYNKMIDILGKFFEFNLAWSLVDKMTKTPSLSSPNHSTFRTIFKRYISAHLVNEAISIYEDKLPQFSLKDDASFFNLIDALCEYKHVIEAQDLIFGENKRYPTKVYNLILRGWCKIGWWGKCREFWEEMDRKGVEKDLISYSIYMDICCKSGKPWKAVKLYKEMKGRKMALDVVAYNTVVRAVGLSQGVDFVERVLREMREMGCEPNVVSYNCVIGLFCESGRVRDGYRVMGEMRGRGIKPDVMTYHCFFGCLERPREILLLFDRMVESGVRPRMDTFVMLMRKFGRWGFLRPVFVVWKRMEELGCSPNEFAYNALIDALVQKGMLEMARMYEQEMLMKGLAAKPRDELGTRFVDDNEKYVSREFCSENS